MTEATAGQDRTVHVRVATDADAAEAQMRGAIAGVQAAADRLTDRIRIRTNLLLNQIDERIRRSMEKFRLRLTELKNKVQQNIVLPFMTRLRAEMARVQRGWKAMGDAVQTGLSRVRQGWENDLGRMRAAMSTLQGHASTVFRRVADAAAPHLERVRTQIERLRRPFEVVQAYGVGAFRIIRDGATAAMRRARQEIEPDLRMIRNGIDGISRAGSAVGNAFRTGFSRAGEFVANLARRVNEASKYTDDYAKIVRRTGLTVQAATRDMTAAMDDQVAATTRLRDVTEKHIDVEERRELAEVRVTRSMRESETAAEALAKAEDKLEKARNKGKASAERIAQLERAVEQARESALQASVRLREEETKRNELVRRVVETNREHTEVLREVEEANERVAESSKLHSAAIRENSTWHGRLGVSISNTVRSLTRLTTAFRNSDNASRTLGERVTNLGDGMDRAGRRAMNLGIGFRFVGQLTSVAGQALSGFGNITQGVSGVMRGAEGAADLLKNGLGQVGQAAGAATSFVIQFGLQLSMFLAIAGAVSFAVGAVGAAIAGLPALIMGAVASFATLALGMDGIKKAYQNGLKPALDQLKTQVSQVFENTLTPAFQRLSNELIPAVTNNLKGLAQEFANIGVSIIDMVNQGENITKIQQIIDNTASSARDLLSPALQNIVQRFIDIGAQRPIMDAMVGIVADLTNNVANWLGEMDRLNLITPAVQALRGALDVTGQAITKVLTSAVQFFTQATPGFNNLVTSVGDLASTLIGDLGGAFNTVLQAASDFIDNIPPDSLDDFKQAVTDLADAFMDFANSPAPEMIVDAITQIIEIFRMFVEVISWVASIDQALTGFFNNLMVSMGTATDETRKSAEEFNRLGTAGETAGSRLETGLGGALDRTASQAPAQAQGIVNGVVTPIEAMPGLTQAQFDQLPPQVQQSLAAASANGGQGARDLAREVDEPISQIPGITQRAFNDLERPVQDGLLRAQGVARPGAQGVVDGIQVPISTLPTLTQEQFSQLPQIVQTQLAQSAAAANEGAEPIPENVRGPMSQVPGITQEEFGKLEPPVREGLLRAAEAARAGAQNTADAASVGGQQVADNWSDELRRIAPDTNSSMAAAAENVRGQGGVAAQRAGAAGVDTSNAWNQGIAPIPADTNSSLAAAAENVRGQGGLAAQRATAAGQDTREGFVTPVGEIPPETQAALDQLPPSVRGPMDQAVTVAQGGADAVRTTVETGFSNAANIAQLQMMRIPQDVQGNMDAAGGAAETGSTRISTALTTNISNAANTVQLQMMRIPQDVQATMDQAAAAAEAGSQRIVTAVSNMANQAGAAAEQGMFRVPNAVGNALRDAGAAAEAGGQRIAQGVKTGVDQAAQAAEGGGQKIATAIKTAMDEAAAAAEQGAAQVAAAAEQMAAAVANAGAQIANSMNQAAAAVVAAMTRIVAAVQQATQRAQQLVQTSFQQIVQIITQALNQAVQVTTQSWQRIVQAFTTGGQRCVQIAQQTARDVVQAFTSQAGAMYQAGYTLISRLADGMIAAQGRALAAARQTAAAIKAQFPASPAKEGPLSGQGDPLRSGAVIVQRLAAGISSQVGLPATALAPMLSQVAALMARTGMASTADNTVVRVDYGSIPDSVWDKLLDLGYRGRPDDKREALYVPRSVLNQTMRGGSSTSGDTDLITAAREVLAAIRSGKTVYEDFSYKGMSDLLDRHNEQLMELWRQSGRDPSDERFLEKLIARSETQTSITGRLIDIMNATANVVMRSVAAASTSGWDVSSSIANSDDPLATRLLDTRSSAPDLYRGHRSGYGYDQNSLDPESQPSTAITPEDLRAALEGMSFRFEDDGRNGIAKLVNRQNRSLARR